MTPNQAITVSVGLLFHDLSEVSGINSGYPAA